MYQLEKHTRVHGGIYLRKLPGKYLGYSEMLGSEGYWWHS
jgi:hypothetical protein